MQIVPKKGGLFLYWCFPKKRDNFWFGVSEKKGTIFTELPRKKGDYFWIGFLGKRGQFSSETGKAIFANSPKKRGANSPEKRGTIFVLMFPEKRGQFLVWSLRKKGDNFYIVSRKKGDYFWIGFLEKREQFSSEFGKAMQFLQRVRK